MFSLCPHLGGGGSGHSGDRGGVRSSRGGGQVSQPMGGQVQLGGVRSVSRWGGGQVQLAGGGGSGPSADGGVVSILRPLAGGMPLAFTQEDFLVLNKFLPLTCYSFPY